MVTVNNIAQQILNENNYTSSDISLTNLESLIDSAIDYVNLQAGTAIADLGGTTESKYLTATENEVITVKLLSSLLMRAYHEKGPHVNFSGLAINQIITDPHYSLFTKMFDLAINRLIGRSFKRT